MKKIFSKFLTILITLVVLGLPFQDTNASTQVKKSLSDINQIEYLTQGIPQGWYIQPIDDDAWGGELALDQNDNPHIVYVAKGITNPYLDILMHAYWDGTNWQTEEVDHDDGSYEGSISNSAIAIDAGGKIHLSYMVGKFWVQGYGGLNYAYLDGSSWITQTIGVVSQDFVVNPSTITDIAVDSMGYPHISYNEIRDTTGDDYSHLRYAHWNGSSWVYQLVDNSEFTAWDHSITVDSNDHPHIVYNNRMWDGSDHPYLKYVVSGGIGWSFYTIDDTCSELPDKLSIAVSTDAQPHITYICRDTQHEPWIKYANNLSGFWQTTVFERGWDPNIAVDGSGKAHMAYSTEQNNLAYAISEANSWITQTVDTASGAWGSSIALDHLGAPYISYSFGNAVRVAIISEKSLIWQTTVFERGWDPNIAVDGSGKAHMAYSTEQNNLAYAISEANSWITQTVDTASGAWGSSIALDYLGAPYISYSFGNAVKLAYRDSAQWYIQSIDDDAWGGELALDQNNRPHIVYVAKGVNNPDLDVLMHAYWDGTTWQAEEVDRDDGSYEGSVSNPAIAIDASGRIHLSYMRGKYWVQDYGGLSYAYSDGSSWITQTIGVVSQDYVVDPNTVTDIAVDSTGYPHISYNEIRDTTGDDYSHLRYAHWDGSSWVYQLVDNSEFTAWDHSITVDSNDHPHIVYNNRMWDGSDHPYLKYVVSGGIGWSFYTIDDTCSELPDKLSIAVSTDAQPHITYICRDTQHEPWIKYANVSSPSDLYAISGRVTTSNGIPIEGVKISGGVGYTTMTDVDGQYTLTGLITGTYTLAAAKAGYNIYPSVLFVDVPPNETSVNFTAEYYKQVVLLVHGWQRTGNFSCEQGITSYEDNGRLSQNFLNDEDKNEDSLPDWLNDDGFDVWSAHWDTGSDGTPSVYDNATCLADQINLLKRKRGVEKITLIAHSMGGIVSRAYLESSDFIFDNKPVDKLFTIGSPHYGINIDLIAFFLNGITFGDTCRTGTLSLHQGLCDVSILGMLLFNDEYSQRAEDVQYYFMSGDANWWKLSKEYKVISSLVPNPDDGPINAWSGLGKDNQSQLSGINGRLTTDEAHGAGSGTYAYYLDRNVHGTGEQSYSYTKCIRPIIRGTGECDSGSVYSKQQGGRSDFSAHTPFEQGIIISESEISHTIVVDGGPTLFASQWGTGTITVTLTDSLGNLIDPNYALAHPDEVLYGADSGVATYYFTDTLPGDWQVNLISGQNVPAQGTHYMTFASLESPMTIDAQTDRLWYSANDTATINLTLSKEPTAASGVAKITLPDGLEKEINLIKVSPNSFEANYLVPNTPGHVEVRVQVNGTANSGIEFSRETVLVFQISPKSATLNNSFAESTDPLLVPYQALLIDVSVNTTSNGTYGLSADLVDAQGNFVAHANNGTNLNAGDGIIQLWFNGKNIYDSKKDGPYTLTNLLLTDKSGASLVILEADNVYKTVKYNYQDFGANPSNWLIYLPTVQR